MSYKKQIKHIMVSSPFVRALYAGMLPDYPKIFVYHRFTPPATAVPHRVSQDVFAWQLDQISRQHNVFTLKDCVTYLIEKGCWPEHAVVLTIDDGYADFYTYAYPELRRRGLAATFFVTTNFIDRKIWICPDRIEFILYNTQKAIVTVPIATDAISLPLATAQQRKIATSWLTAHCKTLTDKKRKAYIASLESLLEVDVPAVPTIAYQSATWSQLADMQRDGIEIGSHTMNHPILSMLNSNQLEEEIIQPMNVIRRQLGKKVRSFCYPNSSERDINDTVLNIVRACGYTCAVFGTNLKRWDLYRLPRLGVSNDRNDFLWKLAGFENFRLIGRIRPERVNK